MCYFFKKLKNLLQFTFEKNNLLCKKREKITCHEEKSQPPRISNGPSLSTDEFCMLTDEQQHHMHCHLSEEMKTLFS